MSAADRFEERLARELRPGKVWVRAACVAHGVRGPYHWTEACVIEAPTLVEVALGWAKEADNLRPCKLCLVGGKGVQPHMRARRH